MRAKTIFILAIAVVVLLASGGLPALTSQARADASDTTPPTVSDVSPPDAATGVVLDSQVEATFSEDIDPSTLDANTFTLTRENDPTPVAATVSYDAAAKKATLTPDRALDPGASYTATLKSGITDLAGNSIAADKVWSFTALTPDLVVNVTSDAADTNPGDGVCDGDDARSGDQCTLRAAIQEADAAKGADTIRFGIPGGGGHTITLTSQLPPMSDASGPIKINGYTQAGSAPNSDPHASNAKIMVEVKGAGDNQFGGLAIESPGNVVRGLALYGLRGAIQLSGTGAHDNRIQGNFLGTNAAGTYSDSEYISGGYASGVRVASGATNNLIGGTSAADRNVISGNGSHGVGLYYSGTNFNRIVGNVIGLTPSGNRRLANRAVGVDINYGASYNTVGGTLRGERNVISGNGREGVEISHHGPYPVTFPTANRVVGNFIGTDLTGTSGPQYAHNGGTRSLDAVHLVDGARDSVIANNVIGNANRSGVAIDGNGVAIDAISGTGTTGNKVYSNRIGITRGGAAIPNHAAGVQVLGGARNSQVGPKNVIANNPTGVRISDAKSFLNKITANAIFNNTGLGIDLAPIGSANKNDLRDADTGANQQQNHPVINSATTSGDATTVKGTLNSIPGTTFVVEFFANPKGTRQGKTYIGEINVSTGPEGDASFAFRPTRSVRSGLAVTATATDPDGNTSELSAPKSVVQQ